MATTHDSSAKAYSCPSPKIVIRNPFTKDFDFYLDGRYVGSAAQEIDAHRRLNALMFEILYRNQPTA